MIEIAKPLATCLLLFSLTPGLCADEIYRWVDEVGVVHFSDRPPAAATEGLKTVEVDSPESASHDPDADPFNIEATAARTQARREQLQEQRDLRLEQSRSRAQSSVPYPEPQPGYSYGYPWGYPVGGRPPRPQPPPRPPPRPQPTPDDTSTLRPPGQSNGVPRRSER